MARKPNQHNGTGPPDGRSPRDDPALSAPPSPRASDSGQAIGAAEGWAILVAAGRGERLGNELPKARVMLGGRPIFLHSLITFLHHPRIREVVLVAPPEPPELEALRDLVIESLGPAAAARVAVIPGGEERQDSVLAGLGELHARGMQPEACVLVHDAARPLVRPALLTRCLDAIDSRLESGPQGELPGLNQGANAWGYPAGVIPALPVRDTLKLVFEERVVVTQPRENLWAVQTPQVFRFGPLYQAHLRARRYGIRGTDDAALLEWQGLPVRIVPGDTGNLKVTFPEDLDLAERLLLPPKPRP